MKLLPSEIDENGNYHFECSTYQVLQYFYRFGGEAQVLQPQSLRELLREEYRKAYEAYGGVHWRLTMNKIEQPEYHLREDE